MWAAGLAKGLCEAEEPGPLTDDQVLAIAAGQAGDVLLQQATRGIMAWREMVRNAQISADEVIPDDVAAQMISDFHAYCAPPPGRMVRKDGRFVFESPGTDLDGTQVSRERLERLIKQAFGWRAA